MERKSISFIVILFFSMTIGIPQLMAQKQERVEKLLKLLIEKETEKLEKGNEKLDEETTKAFANEIQLIGILNRLWNQSDAQSAIDYYPVYVNAMKGAFPAICAACKVETGDIQAKADRNISGLFDSSQDKLTLSKQLIDQIKSCNYPIAQAQMDLFYKTREEELMKDYEKGNSMAKCESYFLEFPDGKYLPRFMNEYNQLLYNTVKRSQTDTNFKKFFDNLTLNKYFDGMSNRKYVTEVQALYDDYLYSMVQQAGALASKKQCVDAYEISPYLAEGVRKHTADLEYTKDSIDYELMKPEVNSSSRLELLREFLTTHKYKEFRDKAHGLRSQFEDSVVWTTPTSMKLYKKGVLMKSEVKQNGKNVTEVYTYLENGSPSGIETSGNGMLLQTFFLYDAHGRCAQEVQVNAKTKKEIYKRTRTFDASGAIQSDSLKYADGRLELNSYNRQGELTDKKMFNKEVMLSSMAHQYDSRGCKVKSQYVFALPNNPLPSQISSQTDTYEYDKYGYPTKIISTQILVNNEKRVCSFFCMYDEYGNPVDSNMYYEYDQTGRWIRKTAKDNPEVTETIVIK